MNSIYLFIELLRVESIAYEQIFLPKSFRQGTFWALARFESDDKSVKLPDVQC